MGSIARANRESEGRSAARQRRAFFVRAPQLRLKLNQARAMSRPIELQAQTGIHARIRDEEIVLFLRRALDDRTPARYPTVDFTKRSAASCRLTRKEVSECRSGVENGFRADVI
jgi:hypothetical protein